MERCAEAATDAASDWTLMFGVAVVWSSLASVPETFALCDVAAVMSALTFGVGRCALTTPSSFKTWLRGTVAPSRVSRIVWICSGGQVVLFWRSWTSFADSGAPCRRMSVRTSDGMSWKSWASFVASAPVSA